MILVVLVATFFCKGISFGTKSKQEEGNIEVWIGENGSQYDTHSDYFMLGYVR